jgi:hypothetical protein
MRTTVLLMTWLMSACTHHPARVNCTGHLRAVNVPQTPATNTGVPHP